MLLSQKFREEGNTIYKTVNDKLSQCIRETRLMKCLNLYQQAINAAGNLSDKAVAYKNHATVSYDLFKINSNPNVYKRSLAVFYLIEGQSSSAIALDCGKESKHSDWLDHIRLKALSLLYDYCELYVVGSSNEDREIPILLKIKEKSMDFVKCQIFYQISLFYYKISITNINTDLKKSFRAINECNYYYEECLKLTNKLNHEVDFDLKELNNNKIIQECSIDGFRQKKLADSLLDHLINHEETLNVEKVWDCIDLYHEAITKAKDKDIELEAEILSKLGLIYTDILVMKNKAKTYYYESFRLAEAMKPKMFTNESWFKRCSSQIKKYQKEVVDEEEKRKEVERKKVISEIQGDLDKIESEAKKCDRVQFIKFVYEKYPAKKQDAKAPTVSKTDSNDTVKKALKQALIHYHPDKNTGEEFGFAWHFIAVDISKNLGSLYEGLK